MKNSLPHSNVYILLKPKKQNSRTIHRSFISSLIIISHLRLFHEYQAIHLLERREVTLELKKGDWVRIQREKVKFIALLFLFSSQPQIWSFQVAVVQGQHYAHAELLFCSEKLLCFRCSHCHCCHSCKGSLTYNASREMHMKCSQTKLKVDSNVFWTSPFHQSKNQSIIC